MTFVPAAMAILIDGVLAILTCIGSNAAHHQQAAPISSYLPTASADFTPDVGWAEQHSAFLYAGPYAPAYLHTPIHLANSPAFLWMSPIINSLHLPAGALTAQASRSDVPNTNGPAAGHADADGAADEASFRSYRIDNGIAAVAHLIRYTDNGNVAEESGSIVFHQGSPLQAVRVFGTLELADAPYAVRIQIHSNADWSNSCQNVGQIYNPWGVLDGGLVLRNGGTIQASFVSFFNVIRSIFQLTLYGASRVIGKSIVVYNEDNLAVACGIISPAANSVQGVRGVNTLMVVGSLVGQFRVEVVGLSENDEPLRTCPQLQNGPVLYGAVGAFIKGNAVVCAGANDPSGCYVYSKQTDTWGKMPGSLISRVFLRAAVVLSDTQWWLTGGFDGRYSTATEVVVLGEDGAVNSMPFPPLPRATAVHALLRLNESAVIFVGGDVISSDLWLFDLRSKKWTQLPNMPSQRFVAPIAGLATFPDGSRQLVVAGGAYDVSTIIFNFGTLQWRSAANGNLPFDIVAATTVQYRQTFLAVAGGSTSGASTLNTIFEFDPANEKWTRRRETLLSNGGYFAAAFLVPDDYVECV